MDKIVLALVILLAAVLLVVGFNRLPNETISKTITTTSTSQSITSITQTTSTTTQQNQTIPLRVFIDENSGKGETFFDNSTVADVRTALKIWEERTKILEFIGVSNEKVADIVIKWSSNLTTKPGVKVVGEAWYRTDTIGGTVYLLPSGMSCRNQNRAMHEIGHLFGLNHSTDYQSIMYQYESCAQNITDEDVSSVLKIFGR